MADKDTQSLERYVHLNPEQTKKSTAVMNEFSMRMVKCYKNGM